jgi:hypothetical protein
MRDSRRTSFLLAAAGALLLVHFFPYLAGPIAWLALAAGTLWAAVFGSRILSFYRKKRALATQQAADDRSYAAYQAELDALRTRFDPHHEWNESTEYPSAYREDLSVLHERYRAMLERRFGPG